MTAHSEMSFTALKNILDVALQATVNPSSPLAVCWTVLYRNNKTQFAASIGFPTQPDEETVEQVKQAAQIASQIAQEKDLMPPEGPMKRPEVEAIEVAPKSSHLFLQAKEKLSHVLNT